MPERRGLSQEYLDEFKKSMKGTAKKKSAPKEKVQRIFYIRISGHPSTTDPVRAFTSLEAKKKYLARYDMKRIGTDDLLNIPENRVSSTFRNRKVIG
jgi:hypothetical protein